MVTPLHEDKLLRFIRTQPRSTQLCRQHMSIDASEEVSDLNSAQTEALLRKLRDEGHIRFANGEWYTHETKQQTRKKRVPQPHLKQMDFFDPEAGTRPFSLQTQLMFEKWRDK